MMPKYTMAKNFVEKTFTNSHKTSKFVMVFSFESVLLYGVGCFYKIIVHTCKASPVWEFRNSIRSGCMK